ncbi:MAG: cation-transporting P-type ATPase, partial [Candidatus Methanoperedens sp.]|nr:cation-transporting P-type ATPase [Candidatus Methanoperedens sp.]
MEQKFDLESITGLSDEDVARILKVDGYNELPSQEKQSLFAILWNVLREPMLLFFVFVVAGITFYQERKTERALVALKNFSSPRALVLRDGKQKRVPGREVVRDDV